MLLLLLTLVLIGTAALIGARLLEGPPGPQKLLYELDGDIFLADADGGSPIRIAEGAELFEGSSWAPDGRHFLAFDSTRLTADVRDPAGQVVASFPNLPAFNSFPVWSPDSTRLQAWTQSEQINVYGVDGALQAELPLPDGYERRRETPSVWAPDGRAVWVQVSRDQTYPCASSGTGPLTDLDPPPCADGEVWELPIDGSPPQPVEENLALAIQGVALSFSRDGTRMAFPSQGQDGNQPTLYVANADGTEARAVVRVGQDSIHYVGWMAPIWSPSGEEIAYRDVGTDHLMVVDVATGTARALVPGWWYLDGPPHSWSRDGDRIMFWKQDGPATQDGSVSGDLWAVGVDGGEPTLLVEGATHGAWQPAPPPTTAAPAPTLAPTPTPRSNADYALHMVATLDELQRVRTANDVNTTFDLLGIEAAWVMDRLPASWMDDPASRQDDPAIAAYVDAVHVLVGVLPDTPAWDEAWASYFATRPALAALVPGQIPTPAP